MDDLTQLDGPEAIEAGPRGYEAPGFSVISLDCEISAYAPDDTGDDIPLF